MSLLKIKQKSSFKVTLFYLVWKYKITLSHLLLLRHNQNWLLFDGLLEKKRMSNYSSFIHYSFYSSPCFGCLDEESNRALTKKLILIESNSLKDHMTGTYICLLFYFYVKFHSVMFKYSKTYIYISRFLKEI